MSALRDTEFRGKVSQEISQKASSCPKCGAPIKKKTALFTWIVTIFLGLLFIGSLSKQGTSPTGDASSASTKSMVTPAPVPASNTIVASGENMQQKFELARTAKFAAYTSAQNEVQASMIYNQTNKEDKKIVATYGSYLRNWVGTIDSIRTEGIVGAEVVIETPSGVTYKPDSYINKGDCWLCDVEVSSISTGSSVYKQLSNLKDGDLVRFSGRLIMDSWESPLDEGGSLEHPDISVRFDSIQLNNNEANLTPTLTKKRGKN